LPVSTAGGIRAAGKCGRAGKLPCRFPRKCPRSEASTIPARPLWVRILNLGCPVLDVLSRAGFLISDCSEKAPPFQGRRTGHSRLKRIGRAIARVDTNRRENSGLQPALTLSIRCRGHRENRVLRQFGARDDCVPDLAEKVCQRARRMRDQDGVGAIVSSDFL